jgi:hypothetical protein
MPKTESLLELPADAAPPSRGTLHVAFGRGRTGKTTWLRTTADRALSAGRPLRLADADVNNSTLTSFFPNCERPSGSDPESVTALFRNVTETLIEERGNLLLDLGGGDRSFAAVAERYDFFRVLPAHGVDIVTWFFVTAGRDDAEQLARMEQLKLQSPKSAIVCNHGLAPTSAADVDPFASCLATRTVTQALSRGVKLVRLPAVDLKTMTAADNLFISIREAAAGGVPLTKGGTAHPDARPLPFWDRIEFGEWLARFEAAHVLAEVAEWLP